MNYYTQDLLQPQDNLSWKWPFSIAICNIVLAGASTFFAVNFLDKEFDFCIHSNVENFKCLSLLFIKCQTFNHTLVWSTFLLAFTGISLGLTNLFLTVHFFRASNKPHCMKLGTLILAGVQLVLGIMAFALISPQQFAIAREGLATAPFAMQKNCAIEEQRLQLRSGIQCNSFQAFVDLKYGSLPVTISEFILQIIIFFMSKRLQSFYITPYSVYKRKTQYKAQLYGTTDQEESALRNNNFRNSVISQGSSYSNYTEKQHQKKDSKKKRFKIKFNSNEISQQSIYINENENVGQEEYINEEFSAKLHQTQKNKHRCTRSSISSQAQNMQRDHCKDGLQVKLFEKAVHTQPF